MEIPSTGDYIEVKKRKALNICNPQRNASAYVANKQYIVLQTTASVDYDDNLEQTKRFDVELPRQDLATLVYPQKRTYPMFSIRK